MAQRKSSKSTSQKGSGGRKASPQPLSEDLRKLQPKLRMLANGSSLVNALRAERTACVGVTLEAPKPSAVPIIQRDVPISARQLKPREVRGTQERAPHDILANIFIETTDTVDDRELEQKIKGPVHRKGNLLTATAPLSQLVAIAGHGTVTRVELGEPVSRPDPIVTAQSSLAPDPSRWRFGDSRVHQNGRDRVLIGIIDVEGFDFSHPDFLDANGETRFVRIWDQGGDARPTPKAQKSSEFDYGAEFKGKEHLNPALVASRQLKVPAFEIERQSQLAVGSHGTHVASIAAGNHGVCREAPIAAVLIALTEDDADRRKSFYDSTRIAHAVDYLIGVATDMGLPISINVSLGTNGHAHDGSSAVSRWVDASLATPGRCVSVAAGNAGQEAPESPNDLGYVMGRIHTSGKVPARDLIKDIDWIVAGNGIADVSENELEIWYSAADRFAVSLLPPGPPDADQWIGPVRPGEFIENLQVSERLPNRLGGSFVSIYNELYHPANGCNYLSLYLSPFYADSGTVGIPAGTWTVRLHGDEVRDGQYHGWIERDDPRPVGRREPQELWNFPSFFSLGSNVDNSSVSSLACGRWIISVANLDERRARIHVTSSQGPTRDHRSKPDVAAPGTDIIAAKGFAGPDDLWIAMTGTSMASPYVTGVAGLMLAATKGRLTAAQIGGIMQRTSRPLSGATFAWANDAGFGVIDPDACLHEAVAANDRKDLNP
jgi:subtilisin family serine protease